jgi:predicted pyridoxine 5'-phosphate oxidase superfamily flavin-nucleotide-binding protein
MPQMSSRGCDHRRMNPPPEDRFAGALRSEAELRELYELPSGLAARKQIDHLDEGCRRLVALAPIVFVASHDADGRADVTPRGGDPGFVGVLDERTLAIPDATGNRRLDTLRNVVATGHAGLLFVIPGRGQTLRVNGRACVTARADVLAGLRAASRRAARSSSPPRRSSPTARRRSSAPSCGTRPAGRTPPPRRAPPRSSTRTSPTPS